MKTFKGLEKVDSKSPTWVVSSNPMIPSLRDQMHEILDDVYRFAGFSSFKQQDDFDKLLTLIDSKVQSAIGERAEAKNINSDILFGMNQTKQIEKILKNNMPIPVWEAWNLNGLRTGDIAVIEYELSKLYAVNLLNKQSK